MNPNTIIAVVETGLHWFLVGGAAFGYALAILAGLVERRS